MQSPMDLRVTMERRQPKFSVWAIVLSVLGPILGSVYFFQRGKFRQPLVCTECIDLRGLNDLVPASYIWLTLAVISVVFAIISFRRNEFYAKLALTVSLTILAAPFVFAMISRLIG